MSTNLSTRKPSGVLSSIYLKNIYDEALSTDYQGKTKITNEIRS